MPDPVRTCGTCTACCTVLGVPSLEKGRHTDCAYAKRAGGCSIYETRPQECRSFDCAWLQGMDLTRPEDRPDQSGLVLVRSTAVVAEKKVGCPIVVAHELFDGAATAYRGEKLIKRLARHAVVIAVFQNRRTFFGPPLAITRAVRLIMSVSPNAEVKNL